MKKLIAALLTLTAIGVAVKVVREVSKKSLNYEDVKLALWIEDNKSIMKDFENGKKILGI